MSNKRKLNLSLEEDRATALEWLEENDDDYLADQNDLLEESELEDNLESDESEPEMLQVFFKFYFNYFILLVLHCIVASFGCR